jgi:hypothetical protein
MLMRHNEHGWHNATGLESEDMKKNGWVEVSEEERRKIIDAKNSPQNVETVIIEPQDVPAKGKPGRKPKNLMGGIYGDNSNQD